MQGELLAFTQYHANLNRLILEEKEKNNINISNFPILSESFFLGLPSCSLLAPHVAIVCKSKEEPPLNKKLLPKSTKKVPISSPAQGKQKTPQPPKKSKSTSKLRMMNMKKRLQHT